MKHFLIELIKAKNRPLFYLLLPIYALYPPLYNFSLSSGFWEAKFERWAARNESDNMTVYFMTSFLSVTPLFLAFLAAILAILVFTVDKPKENSPGVLAFVPVRPKELLVGKCFFVFLCLVPYSIVFTAALYYTSAANGLDTGLLKPVFLFADVLLTSFLFSMFAVLCHILTKKWFLLPCLVFMGFLYRILPGNLYYSSVISSLILTEGYTALLLLYIPVYSLAVAGLGYLYLKRWLGYAHNLALP